jgi:hypothetical protein
MDYNAAGANVVGRAYAQQLADPRPTATAVEKPRIVKQLDQLEKVIAECHHLAGSVENAADRILGPTPQDGTKDAPRPPSSTLEQRFAEAISAAELLAHRLSSAAQRLNAAV